MIPSKYKVRHHTFRRYVKLKRGVELTGLPPSTIFKRISKSPFIHGIVINDEELLIHPEGFYKLVSSMMRRRLRKLAKEKILSLKGPP